VVAGASPRRRVVLWIGVDVVYVGMYAVKALHATAALYLVFVALAVAGLRTWKKTARQEGRHGAAHR